MPDSTYVVVLFWHFLNLLIYFPMQSLISLRQIVKTLISHRKLANTRNFSYTENKFAKVMIGISTSFIVLYLIALSIPFAMIANDLRTMTSTEMLFIIAPFILFVDFGSRFLMQQTPAQIVRPYLLLPISRRSCINAFIFSSIFTWGNIVWLTFVIPYVLMSIVFSYGLLTSFITILVFAVLVAVNSQWYLIVRTLINETFWWWILPVFVYFIALLPMFISGSIDLDRFTDTYSLIGAAIDEHNPLVIVLVISFLAIMVTINREVQYRCVQRELMRLEKKEVVNKVNKFVFLERYGEVGTFLQLEVKLLTRNKNPRKAFFSAILTMIVLSIVIIFSDIYDSIAMTNFWALYNFVLLGSMLLVRMMGYEGNYIDCMFVHRENILAVLKAKYIFYSLLLTLPFVLMLPVVLSDKWSLYMLVSYAVFTMGFQYFMLFQTAVYNKQTISLNEKLTTKGGLDGNYMQIFITIAILVIPNIIVTILQSILNNNVAYTVMLLIGLIFVSTSNIWLRNIYKRIMQRKYLLLESFIATR